MGWLLVAFLVVLICVIKWSLEPLKDCKRVELGYRCKGSKCECNNKGDD